MDRRSKEKQSDVPKQNLDSLEMAVHKEAEEKVASNVERRDILPANVQMETDNTTEIEEEEEEAQETSEEDQTHQKTETNIVEEDEAIQVLIPAQRGETKEEKIPVQAIREDLPRENIREGGAAVAAEIIRKSQSTTEAPSVQRRRAEEDLQVQAENDSNPLNK